MKNKVRMFIFGNFVSFFPIFGQIFFIMKIIVSTTTDPWANLEEEKRRFAEHTYGDLLLLYINAPSVIIGKNQLAEAEADIDYCQRHGIPVLRRLSGGGAVYHDPGNINYAFITDAPKSGALDRDFLEPVIAALQSFNIAVQIGKRKELIAYSKKISGTASHISRGRQLFHGTLLYDTDLERMRLALNGNVSLRGRHVASVPSAVGNIAEMLAEKVSAQEFMMKLADFFERYFNTPSL
jgi:lipoate-protein ligase A